jgi:predicted Zn-dependent protease
MAESSKQRSPPEFASTHPAHETRIQQLKQWMPEALALYEGKVER